MVNEEWHRLWIREALSAALSPAGTGKVFPLNLSSPPLSIPIFFLCFLTLDPSSTAAALLLQRHVNACLLLHSAFAPSNNLAVVPTCNWEALELNFSVGIASVGFGIKNFLERAQCGREFDCGNGGVSKLRVNLLVFLLIKNL